MCGCECLCLCLCISPSAPPPSPQFALRSYLYVGLHSAVGAIFAALGFNKAAVFHFTKLALAAACAASETYFYRAVAVKFGNTAGALTLVFLATSAGMAHAAAGALCVCVAP